MKIKAVLKFSGAGGHHKSLPQENLKYYHEVLKMISVIIFIMRKIVVEVLKDEDSYYMSHDSKLVKYTFCSWPCTRQ